ncbi:MAG: bifunctional diaminohydroxyphosphoribosylaminopyrimidine deaminase/5-amino-6-(5-phosphoribosylamino)uracil reductase RibD [Pseudomonadales bacterium]|nr:bifunctional diaminohydroxyphosphoribosylaminopyrimidine deaminase/5-amino-6-(5-phosphoribosylamino)uracil reductase RibD [Pseudomonadales bacterium]
MNTVTAQPDEYFMALALREAERGLYTTQPNPRVGCVLVREGQIIATGFHLQAGSGHAEANALAAAGAGAAGSTAYVTLEPCSFTGRTPSCAESLIAAGIQRVVYAMTDPHPRNRGRGLEKLRAAGIRVEGPVLEASARQLNPGHIKRFEQGLPWVRMKLAMTLDGKIALANGASQWITGPDARADVQKLRARSSAVITGVGTVTDDDPSLTVRSDSLQAEYASLAEEIPRRIVVMDRSLRTPPGARLLQNPQHLIVCDQALAESAPAGWQIAGIGCNAEDQPDLGELLRLLAAEECNEVLFECGPTLAGSVIRSGYLDELVVYMAPKLMGNHAQSLLNMPAIDNMRDLIELDWTDVRQVGRDIRLTARVSTGQNH